MVFPPTTYYTPTNTQHTLPRTPLPQNLHIPHTPPQQQQPRLNTYAQPLGTPIIHITNFKPSYRKTNGEPKNALTNFSVTSKHLTRTLRNGSPKHTSSTPTTSSMNTNYYSCQNSHEINYKKKTLVESQKSPNNG